MVAVFLSMLGFVPALAASADGGRYFTITVVDEHTGRGVPLVELTTVNNIRCCTDSHGVVAFHEPGLMNQRAFFHVKSHGYEFPKDGFGYAGQALDVTEGGSALLKIRRVNIAERLYRITGQGIYRDSVLLGKAVPIQQPVINGLVLGSDSVLNVIHAGKLYWFWGDTNRPGYPLGNFQVTGATSLLPGQGGPDPDVGVDLTYFVDETGFARKMAPMPGSPPTWLDGLVTLPDENGREQMFACYSRVTPAMETTERGLVKFNDATAAFEKLVQFDLKVPLQPSAHPFKHTDQGTEFLYFPAPFPLVRVRADLASLLDLTRYEGYSCLAEGSRPDSPRIDRDPAGAIRYAWKKRTPPLSPKEQGDLIKAGQLKPEEALLQLQDADTGKPISPHSGSVYWNDYRKRWITIRCEGMGTSVLGETWYAEADTPVGPWVYARKIVTHDKYSFYNPKQHPMFDRDDGRIIYFEGTYTNTFSGNPDQTPRYDYNQVMYKLDLADPRLVLPVPVYRLGDRDHGPWRTRENLPAGRERRSIAFFALDRPGTGTLPIYEEQVVGSMRLRPGTASRPAEPALTPVFHALPWDSKDPPPTTVPLYEFVHKDGQRWSYQTDESWSTAGYARTPAPVCRVWRCPIRLEWELP